MSGFDPNGRGNGQPPNNNGNENKKRLFMGLALAGALLYAFNIASTGDDQSHDIGTQDTVVSQDASNGNGVSTRQQISEIGYSEFKDYLENDKVEEVTFQNQGGDRLIKIELTDGTKFYTVAVEDSGLIGELEAKDVDYSQIKEPPPAQPGFLMTFGPTLLFIAFFIFMMRKKMGLGNGGPGGIGQSKAKINMEGDVKVGFDDVAGIDHVKEDLEEMVEFLKDPRKFQRLGAKMPSGALLIGPPGTGKTLLARALAGEANVPFISTSGSEFVEMFVGVGASRVRDIFAKAKKNAPCIIFIDEIDAVGRQRGTGMGGGHDEREQTLNQLLVEMDGFEENPGIIVLAATNRPDVLDPALKRPGRFDRQVQVGLPDLIGRQRILEVHMRSIPVSDRVSSLKVAQGTPGFAGADLANLVNEAALLAARRGKDAVDMDDFEGAKDKIMMGAERPTLSMSDDERKLTAYHEAGHALLSYLQRDRMDPIHKATIIPRGGALGMVISLPERDKVSVKRKELVAKLAMAYGGTAAEELTFGGPDEVTTGATGDIQQATKIARAMVTQYGFSEKLGKVQYEGNEQEVFLGRAVSQHKTISEATAQLIDEEVKRLTDEAHDAAKKTIKDNWDAFERLAETLLEYETLTGQEVGRVIEGQPVGRNPEDPPGIADIMPEDLQAAEAANDNPGATGGPEPLNMRISGPGM